MLKILCMKKDVLNIIEHLDFHMKNDTNVIITLNSNDKTLKFLVSELNKQLKILRKQKLKYQNGDKELKEEITNISHDIRTPLTAILGYVDLINTQENTQNQNRYIALIENRALALKNMTDELFKYSLIMSTAQEMELKSVNVNDILQESIAAFYAPLKAKSIEPIINIPNTAVVAKLNGVALNRIFNNIIENAIKYSGGDLRITLEENKKIIFENIAEDINEIDVGKLFNRFYSVKTANNSTGIGLAIAKALTEQMSGVITAKVSNNTLKVCVQFE